MRSNFNLGATVIRCLLPIFGLSCAFLVSCETVVEIDLPDTPRRLTVNSVAWPDNAWEVRVSASYPILEYNYNDTPFETPEGTVVKVLSQEGEEVLVYQEGEFEYEKGTFVGGQRFLPVAGQTYTLEVSAPGFPTARATTTVPLPVPILQADLEVRGLSNNGSGMMDVDGKFQFADPPGQPNYYIAELYQEIPVGFSPIYDENNALIGLDTIYQWSPVYLYTADVSVENADTQSGENWLLFSDRLFNGRNYQLIVDGEASVNARRFMFVLRHISPEWWRYALSADKHILSDGDPFAEPVQVQGNVENGFGVFGAFAFDSLAVMR